MKLDYRPRCIPFSKKGKRDKYFLLLISKTTEISLKITFKNNTFTRQRILIVPEHSTLKRLHQFAAPMKVPPDNKKQSSFFNSSFNIFIPTICYFKALQACLGIKENTDLIKLSQFIAPVDRYATLSLLCNFYEI